MEDVLQIRDALDELAASIACEQISEEELAELRHTMHEFEESTKTGDVKRIAEADVRFHDIIYHATRNVKLENMLNNLREQMYRYRLEYVKDEANYKRLIAEHRVIYEAIRDRDRQTGAEAIKNHIDNQEKAVIRMITSASGKTKR